jgi:hypothetical protein
MHAKIVKRAKTIKLGKHKIATIKKKKTIRQILFSNKKTNSKA